MVCWAGTLTFPGYPILIASSFLLYEDKHKHLKIFPYITGKKFQVLPAQSSTENKQAVKRQNRSGRCSNNSCYFPSLKLGLHEIFFLMHSYFSHCGCVWVLSRNELNDLINLSHMLYFSQDVPIRRIVGLQVLIQKLRDPILKYILLYVYHKEDKLRKISVSCIWMQFGCFL